MATPEQMLRQIMAGGNQQQGPPGPLPMEQGGGSPVAPEDITGIIPAGTTEDQEASMEVVGQIIQLLQAAIQMSPQWGTFLNKALADIHTGLSNTTRDALKKPTASAFAGPQQQRGMMGGGMGR